MKEEHWKDYFMKDIWNLCDILFFCVYVSYLPISFHYTPDAYVVKVLQCSIVGLLLVKLNFFLRIFDEFSFLVQMIQTVFIDVR